MWPRSEGLSTNIAARDVLPDLAGLPSVPILATDILTGRAEGAQPTGAAARLGELRKPSPSRALRVLHWQTEKFCSMDAFILVQKDAATAVAGILATNVGCAMCLIPCASA